MVAAKAQIREILLTVKPKKTLQRELVVNKIKNLDLRNRAHAYLTRTVMNLGMSKPEADLYAGLHSLIPPKAHTFIKKEDAQALLYAKHPAIQPVIPRATHKENNGNISTYLEEIKKDGDSGYAEEMRKERAKIPYELREAGTVFLGKFFKYGPQGISDTEKLIAKEYINSLKEQQASNHFKILKSNDLLKALDGDKQATKKIQAAIANAAKQTPLGQAQTKQQTQLSRREFLKLSAAAAGGALLATKSGKLLEAVGNFFSKNPSNTTKTTTTSTTLKPTTTTLYLPKTREEYYKFHEGYLQKIRDKKLEFFMRDVGGSTDPLAFATRFIGVNSDAIKREIAVRRGELPLQDSPVIAARNYLGFAKDGPLKSNPNINSSSKTERELGVLQEWADAIDLAAQYYTPEQIDAYVSSKYYSKLAGEDAKQNGDTFEGTLRMVGITKYGSQVVPPGPKNSPR